MRDRNLKVATVVACILVAGVPPLWFTRYLDSHAVAGAEAILHDHAEGMVGRVDRMLDESSETLRALPAAGVERCDATAREALRAALYDRHFLRRIRVADGDGSVRCDTAEAAWRGTVLSSAPAIGDAGNVAILMDQETGVRSLALVRERAGGGEIVAELAPGSVALDPLPPRWRGRGEARLGLLDGTALASDAGTPAEDADRAARADELSVEVASTRYPVKAGMAVSRATVLAPYDRLKLYGLAAMALFAVLVVCIAIRIAWGRPSMSDDIARGLEQGEFLPFYQPVINLQTGRLVGCEVLLRRRRSDGTIDSPGSFIAQAEADGQIIPVTRYIMRQVISDLGDHYRRHADLSVAFNLCEAHFRDDEVVRDVQDIFGGSPIRFRQLVFEVTERFPLVDMAKAKTIIAKLQAVGAKIALDDAGTGHSGLAALHRLGMDIVKIDKIFIDSIDATTTQAPIVDSLVELAKSLGMEVVAEGVETLDHVRYLREKGVDTAQGYLFAPPLPAASYIALLLAMRSRRRSVSEPATAA